MMNDAQDQHQVVLHAIEDSVPSMHKTSHISRDIRLCHAAERAVTQQGECLIETPEIGIRHICSKLGKAVLADFNKILLCRLAKPQPSHWRQGIG